MHTVTGLLPLRSSLWTSPTSHPESLVSHVPCYLACIPGKSLEQNLRAVLWLNIKGVLVVYKTTSKVKWHFKSGTVPLHRSLVTFLYTCTCTCTCVMLPALVLKARLAIVRSGSASCMFHLHVACQSSHRDDCPTFDIVCSGFNY